MAMETKDYITAILSVSAIVVSIISVLQSRKAIKNSDKTTIMQEQALKLQEAQLESQLNSSIAAATAQITQAGVALSNKNETDKDYPVLEQILTTATESLLNAYDQACLSYREGKLNKVTFKKAYHVPIRSLIERKDLREFFYPANSSKFPSILNVYEEWETKQR